MSYSKNLLGSLSTFAQSALPSAAGKTQFAKLTDINKGLVYSNGAAWVPAEGQQVYTLEAFGGKADDVAFRAANLAAWDAIMAAGALTLSGQGPSGPIIVLQSGIYYFSDMIDMTIPCQLIGQGAAYSGARTIIDLPIGKRGLSAKSTSISNGPTGGKLKGFCLQSANNPALRQNTTLYNVGDVVGPPISPYGGGSNYTGWGDTGYLYVCSIQGTSAGSPPSDFATTCNTNATRTEVDQAPFTDGTCQWTPVQCHGMNVGAGLMTFEDILVQGFAGDGWHCYGNTTDTSTDLDRFLRCHALQNSGSGWYDAGADSSVIYMESFNSIVNGGWAIIDNGFLGNTHISHHCRSNGTGGGGGGVWLPNNFGWYVGQRAGPTQQNGYLYGVQSIVGGGPYGTTGATEPTWPTTPGDTVTNGNIVFVCLRLYDGGAYSNRDSVFVGCYSEADQQPSVFGVVGQGGFYQGFHGAGFQTDGGLNASGLVEFGRYTNSRATQSKIVDPGQGYGITSYFGPDNTAPNVFGWERFTLADGQLVVGSGIRIQYSYADGYWYFVSALDPNGKSIGIPTAQAADGEAGPVSLPNGFKINGTVRVTADYPLGHNFSSYTIGDFIWKEDLTAGALEGNYAAWRAVATGAIATPGNIAPALLCPNFAGKIVDALTPVKETDLQVVYDDTLVNQPASALNFNDRASGYLVTAHSAQVFNNNQYCIQPGFRTSSGRNRMHCFGIGYFSLASNAAHTIQTTDQWTIEAVLCGVAGNEIGTLIGYKTVAGTCGYALFTQADGSLRFQIYNTTPGNYVDLVTSAALLPITPSKIYHIAITIDMVNSVFAMYVNGVLQASATSTTGTYSAANADIGLSAFLQNGSATNAGNNTGKMEIVRTRRLFTQNEIVARAAQICIANGVASPTLVGVETLLSSTLVDASIGTKQALYTVPTARSCIPTKFMYRAQNNAGTTAINSAGFDANADDVIAVPGGVVIGATGTFVIQEPSGTAGSAPVVGNAGDVLGVKFTATQASLTFIVDTFGYLV